MNLSPVIVKVRPAWRRLAYRLGRHPLPVPGFAPFPLPAPESWVPAPGQLEPNLERWPSPRVPAGPVAVANGNGNGHKPGPLTEADR